jgi:succinate dehydrogenase / fumarate reductase flavoprotein subunit
VNGLYAIGECSATSVHGANRLGTNSLLDLIVFGRAAGNHIVAAHPERQHAHQPLPQESVDFSLDRVNKLETRTKGEKTQVVGNDIRNAMQQHCGVFRTLASLKEGVQKIDALAEKVDNIAYTDKSKVFNTARIEALELSNMIEVARSTIHSAVPKVVAPMRLTITRHATMTIGLSTPCGTQRATVWITSLCKCNLSPSKASRLSRVPSKTSYLDTYHEHKTHREV